MDAAHTLWIPCYYCKVCQGDAEHASIMTSTYTLSHTSNGTENAGYHTHTSILRYWDLLHTPKVSALLWGTAGRHRISHTVTSIPKKCTCGVILRMLTPRESAVLWDSTGGLQLDRLQHSHLFSTPVACIWGCIHPEHTYSAHLLPVSEAAYAQSFSSVVRKCRMH